MVRVPEVVLSLPKSQRKKKKIIMIRGMLKYTSRFESRPRYNKAELDRGKINGEQILKFPLKSGSEYYKQYL